MSRYNFTSPGGQAANAIEAFLLQRAQLNRQAQLDELRKQAQEAEIRQRDEALANTRRGQDIADAQRTDALNSLNDERDFRRASTVADTMVPGVVDGDTAALLQKHGYGGLVSHVDVPGTPGIMDTAGGFRWQQQRQIEAARAEAAHAAQDAAKEKADADREAANQRAADANATREAIAQAAAGGRSETNALRNDLLRTQIDAANDKKAQADQALTNAKSAESDLAKRMLSELDRLTESDQNGGYRLKSGAQSISGPARVPGVVAGLGLPFMGDSTDANAALKRLQALLDVNTLRELKSQSKTGATGFGALSTRELGVLENAAAMLDPAQTESTFLERLNDIRSAAGKLQGGGGAGRVYYDANGNPIQR